MSLTMYQVDAFTERPFSGNPAAVFILPGPRDEQWLQDVAREMNLSETAFLVQAADGYDLRWFTPYTEVELCGHATLASAHVLWETGRLGRDKQARFHTRSGLLMAVYDNRGWIEMDFPAQLAGEAPPPDGLLDALEVSPRYVGKNAWDYLIEVESEDEVRGLNPDFNLLKRVPARGIIVTSAALGKDYDFVSRFFAPAVGVDEDPVTGSAHCCLGPYWSAKLKKMELTAFQASARSGLIRIRLGGDRVFISGKAVTILRGELVE